MGSNSPVGATISMSNAAAESKEYCRDRWKILSDNGLTAFAIANHLVGQAICDNIDERHQAILPPEIWKDGNPEGVRQRAAEQMKKTRSGGAQIHRYQAAGGHAIPGGGNRFQRLESSGTPVTHFRQRAKNFSRKGLMILPSVSYRSWMFSTN